MKKVLISCVAIATIIVAACGGGGKEASTAASTSSPAASESAVMSDPVFKEGLALTEAQDCATCHKIADKFTGPSYLEIANKYTDDDKTVAMLAGKIIKGGTGVWGQGVMTPHAKLSTEAAEKMVRYILLTKKI